MIKTKAKQSSGFTLIELLVVISIIGVLTAIILPNMMNMRARARDSKRKAALNELKTALRMYYNDNQSYPLSNGSYVIVGCGNNNNCTSDCPWGNEFSCDNQTYMKQLPDDKQHSFGYISESNGERFYAWAILENDGDSDIQKSQDKCNPSHLVNNAFYVCSD